MLCGNPSPKIVSLFCNLMVLVPAGGVTFLSLNKKVTKEVSLERRLLIAPAMKAALSKNFPGALLPTSGLPGHIPKGAAYYKNVSQSNDTETAGCCMCYRSTS